MPPAVPIPVQMEGGSDRTRGIREGQGVWRAGFRPSGRSPSPVPPGSGDSKHGSPQSREGGTGRARTLG